LETIAVTHLPEHAASFLRRFPEVDLSVNTGDTHSLVRQVLDHKVDGAFVYGPVEYTDIKQIPVSREELVLISPEEGAIEDMLRLPMLFFGTGCSHRDRVKRLLEEAKNHRIWHIGSRYQRCFRWFGDGVAAKVGHCLLSLSPKGVRSPASRIISGYDDRVYLQKRLFYDQCISAVYCRIE
jgi:DNA-binding transcriptional LysR family regulator